MRDSLKEAIPKEKRVLIYALYFIHIVISIFLILVVLLQQGKGADLSVFGGGGTQVAFGARGAATVLHKLTVTCFVLFLLTTITLGILNSRSNPSVMQGVGGELVGSEEEQPLSGPAGGTLEDEEQGEADAPGTDGDAAAAEGDDAQPTTEDEPPDEAAGDDSAGDGSAADGG